MVPPISARDFLDFAKTKIRMCVMQVWRQTSAHAICLDNPKPYAQTGMYSVQLGGDATRLHWFADGVIE